jgi:hypothetical protein
LWLDFLLRNDTDILIQNRGSLTDFGLDILFLLDHGLESWVMFIPQGLDVLKTRGEFSIQCDDSSLETWQKFLFLKRSFCIASDNLRNPIFKQSTELHG